MKRSKGERRRGWGERWSEADAREFLGRWRESGKLLPAYCREEGIGYERVRRWHAKLERESVSTPGARSIPFCPVRIVSDLSPASAVLLRRALIRVEIDREHHDEALRMIDEQLAKKPQDRLVPAALRGVGGAYPLKLYLVAGNIDGLPTGVYRYGPHAHDLTKAEDRDRRI